MQSVLLVSKTRERHLVIVDSMKKIYGEIGISTLLSCIVCHWTIEK